MCVAMSQILPAKPSTVRLKAEGNMAMLDISKIHLDVPGLFVADSKVALLDILSDMKVKAALRAEDAHGAKVEANATLDIEAEKYNADISFDNLVINHYVPMVDNASFTGQATATGQGFDFSLQRRALRLLPTFMNRVLGRLISATCLPICLFADIS